VSPNNRRRPGTKAAVTILAAAVIGSNVLAWQTAKDLFPDLSLTPRPEQTVDLPEPLPAGPATAQVAYTTTPADQVLQGVLDVDAPTLLGRGFTAGPVRARVHGAPFTGSCLRQLPSEVTPVRGYARDGQGRGGGVTVQLWAYGAGQGARVVEDLRGRLRTCTPAAGYTPYLSAGAVTDADGFTATSTAGAQPVVWVVWQRGDVVASVAYTRFSGAGLTAAHQVARSVDDLLTRRLAPHCRDLSPSVDDARRNPYTSGEDYTGHTRTVRLTVPVPPQLDEPAAAPVPETSVPEPVAMPDLAPVLVPDRSTWEDTNADGIGDTPPPVEDAPRGPAPVLIDPDAVAVPEGLPTVEPPYPARPQRPEEKVAVEVPAVDTAGPGCGWAFLGQEAPVVDRDRIARDTEELLAAALVEGTRRAAEYEVAQAGWVAKALDYQEKLAAYTAYQRLQQVIDRARADLGRARSEHEASLARYAAVVEEAAAELERLLNPPGTGQDEDEPTLPDPADPTDGTPTTPAPPDPTTPAPPDPTTPAPPDPTTPPPPPDPDPVDPTDPGDPTTTLPPNLGS
jgi:hypothetical protein